MSKLELILLGRFECLLSTGTRVSLAMRKAEVLLAFLALAPGLRHPRERLINLLWSDRGEQQARNSLRQCLSAIRKSLGEAADMVLQIDRNSVCLNAELIEVDVHEFERLAGNGDYESLLTAADLYQGEFLEGISIRDAASQEWLDGERARFKRQFVEILHHLAETQFLSHDYAHALRSTERLVEQDPLDEAGWRLLMQSHADAGNRNHALLAFKRCRQSLQQELGIEPEAATVELRERIAAGDAGRRIPSSASRISPDSDRRDTRTGEHSIAVLPFDNLSGDPEQEYFSDGITESIIFSLALFPDLQVKSRNSSFAFKQQLKGLAEISRELDVDYLVEGSVRKSTDRIRITVQLIEAAHGNQVWGKRYDSDLADLFELEEELSRAIAATVTGRIISDLQRVALARGAAGQESYDLLMSGRYHFYRFDREGMVLAIDRANRCLEQDPDNVRAHELLYGAHSMNYLGRWSEDHLESFRLAGNHIRRALALGPEFPTVQAFYAEYSVYRGDFETAHKLLDKALEINPNDPDAITTRALCLIAQGEFEAALAMSESAIRLDPYHPWAEWEPIASLSMLQRYEEALAAFDNLRTSPGFTEVFRVVALDGLGRPNEARDALQNFLRECRETMLSMPQTVDEWYRYIRENYPFVDARHNQHIVDCLRRAGLESATANKTAEPSEDLPSIAVLPFDNLSGDPRQEYFSDGITASIILSLGLFSGLGVKSKNSSFAYKNSGKSSQQIADELNVGYLVEGSILKSARNIRVFVQLIESSSGNQVWGRQYDAELTDILELEQELSQSIAATISGRLGHKIQQSAAHKPARDLQSYDYLLRGLYHFGKFTADDFEIAKREIGKCLEIDADNAKAHANLGMIHHVEVGEGWSGDPDRSRQLARHHFETAVEVDPDNSLAHAYLAEFLVSLREFERAEFHADKAIELNPTDPDGYMVKAEVLGYTRRVDEALPYADRSLALDPHSVGAGWVAGGTYRKAGQYQKAIKTLRSISRPPASVHALIAACFIGLDLTREARNEMQRYQALARQQMTAYPRSEEAWRAHWRFYEAYQHEEDFDAMFEQLLAAGLCGDSAEPTEDMP